MIEIKGSQTLKKIWSSSCKINQMNMLITELIIELNFRHISAMFCLFISLQSQRKKKKAFFLLLSLFTFTFEKVCYSVKETLEV